MGEPRTPTMTTTGGSTTVSEQAGNDYCCNSDFCSRCGGLGTNRAAVMVADLTASLSREREESERLRGELAAVKDEIAATDLMLAAERDALRVTSSSLRTERSLRERAEGVLGEALVKLRYVLATAFCRSCRGVPNETCPFKEAEDFLSRHPSSQHPFTAFAAKLGSLPTSAMASGDPLPPPDPSCQPYPPNPDCPYMCEHCTEKCGHQHDREPHVHPASARTMALMKELTRGHPSSQPRPEGDGSGEGT